ncbi:MAG: hypothetical protein QME44_00645 [Thermodesulfobacteriota bacterium]|nr:hypothetical protein [Thermodesulfobacteriota bacterium]
MPIDWYIIKKEHVEEACRQYDLGCRPTPEAKNTFLLVRKDKYPAKFILGLAYEMAGGRKLNRSVDYSGGAQTVQILKKLGFSTEYKGRIVKGAYTEEDIGKCNVSCKCESSKKARLNAKQQKIVLKKILEKQFGSVESEKTFDWLVVPDESSMDTVLAKIYNAIGLFRGNHNFATPGERLKCDFFIPSRNLIIEYDERQHFSELRAISLDLYLPDMSFSFDIECWKRECRSIKAKDSDKRDPCRDEKRAFYDSIRDIFAARNGVNLVRIKHGDYDWEKMRGKEIIMSLLGSPPIQGVARPQFSKEANNREWTMAGTTS